MSEYGREISEYLNVFIPSQDRKGDCKVKDWNCVNLERVNFHISSQEYSQYLNKI